MRIFWTQGYESTTTAALEEATSLSRSSLLNTFGSKEELLLAALDRYLALFDEVLMQPLREGSRGLEDIDRFLSTLRALKSSGSGAAGCLVVNLSPGSLASSGVRARMDRYLDALSDGFGAALRRASARGEVPAAGMVARRRLLVSAAVAINWTARVEGPLAAQRLADAVRAQVRDWA